MTAIKASWAHSSIAHHWKDLLRIAGREERMPVALSRGRNGDPKTFEMFACGHYGCVFKTSAPGVVFKITSDPDEAGFAEACIRTIGGDPAPGIVRYHAITELPDARLGRPTYALWREEAFDVGRTIKPFTRVNGWLALFQCAAAEARVVVRAAKDRRKTGMESLAIARDGSPPDVSEWDCRTLSEAIKRSHGGRVRVGAERAGMAITMAIHFAEKLSHASPSSFVGAELLRWIDMGVLLCDVHLMNIGKAERIGAMEAIITDPGHALLLDGSFDGVRVPDIEHAARTGWRTGERRDNPSGPRERALRDLFERERRRFAAVYPSVAPVKLEISDAACNKEGPCAKRDIAFASWLRGPRGKKTRQAVTLVRRALAMPHDNLVAVVRHELGHLCDPRADEPGPGSEARADRIAEEIGGQHLNYDRNDLQTVGPGKTKRPKYLHQ